MNATNYRKALRASLIEKKGGRCCYCFTPEKLEFHHIDPTTKIGSIAQLIRTCPKMLVEREADKCILLCQYCHKEWHKENGR